jgi:hypothetical protein
MNLFAFQIGLAVILAVTFSIRTEAQNLLAGVSKVDITPPVGFRCGGGYGEAISTGIDDPLMAKAIVLQQGDRSSAIVISDLLSVPPDLSRDARQGASRRTGIPAENIVIAATHNHGSPEFWGTLRDIAHAEAVKTHGSDPHEKIDYQTKLVDAWVEAVAMAHDACRPVSIDISIAKQHGLAFNRRFHMKNGTVRFNPGAGNPDIVRPAGPVDSDLPIVLFRSDDEKRIPVASLTTFAMHTAVHGGRTFSGDFPAILQRELRAKLGRDFISVFAEGTAGDINHIDVSDMHPLRGRPEVERIGIALSETVTGAIQAMTSARTPDLAVASKTAFATFQPISEARYHEALHQLREQDSLGLPFLTLVAAWRDCHRWRYTRQFVDGQKPLQIQGIRLTPDTAIVALPHEVFVEIGLAIKATSPFRNTIVMSLSGDVDYYLPTRRAFAEGSYEVTTCPLDPGCGELLLDTARAVLLDLKTGSP